MFTHRGRNFEEEVEVIKHVLEGWGWWVSERSASGMSLTEKGKVRVMVMGSGGRGEKLLPML
eukprot:751362-Hanusia_phi.AAC.2